MLIDNRFLKSNDLIVKLKNKKSMKRSSFENNDDIKEDSLKFTKKI